MTRFTSNVQKGGALLEDSRRLAEVWDPTLDPDTNLARIVEGNLLGKPSRARLDDILRRILKPRFCDPGPQVLAALRHLLDRPAVFAEACYYEAARDDALLATFAEGPLYDWYAAGRATATVEDATDWLAKLAADGLTSGWSENVRTKVARGLLAALRDFGVLEGERAKRFPVPRMSPTGFAYAAYREHEQGRSARALIEGRLWRRWLLGDERVADLLAQAQRLGVLRVARAGSALRIDWQVRSLEEVARAAS